MVEFEGYERRINQINKVLAENGLKDLEEAKAICDEKGVDVAKLVKGIQPIAFENAVWAYTLGAALAIKQGVKTVEEAKKASDESKPKAKRNTKRFEPTSTTDTMGAIETSWAIIDSELENNGKAGK